MKFNKLLLNRLRFWLRLRLDSLQSGDFLFCCVDVVAPLNRLGNLLGILLAGSYTHRDFCTDVVIGCKFGLTVLKDTLLLVDERVNLVLFHIRFNFK